MSFNPKMLIEVAILCLALAVSCSGTTRSVVLNGLKFDIDEHTGAVVQMSYPATGVILKAAPESAGLVDVAYPTAEFAPMRLASRFSSAKIDQDADSVTITYDQLGPSRPNFPLPEGKVSAQVKISRAPDGRSVIMSCTVDNHSSAQVPQVLFPDFPGLRQFDDAKDMQLRFGRGVVKPFEQPIKPTDTAPFYEGRGWKEYPPSSYYGMNTLRWLDYGSYKGGLSVFQRKWATQDMPTVRTWRSESDPESLRLLWDHKALIEPGKTWSSGEFWLTPHPGGWAKGIEVFRDYVKQVGPHLDMPKHVREGVGFQTIWMIQTAESDPAKAAFKFTDIPAVAKNTAKHGLDELVLWGYCTYSTLPIPLRPELGTQQEFLDGIKEAKKVGVNVTPFISVQIVRNKYAERYGVSPATSDWTYHYELIPNFRPFYTKFWDGAGVDPGNKVWDDDLVSGLSKWIDLGAPSFCYDVFGNSATKECQTKLVELTDEIRAKARAKDPEAVFSGESVIVGSFEFDGSALDYLWNWTEYLEAGPMLNVLRSPRPNCNVEDSPLVVKKAFCDGLYINMMLKKPDLPNGTALISDNPKLAAAIEQVSKLRKQFVRYYTDGTMIGDSVLSKPTTGFVSAHQLEGKLLVIVLNDKDKNQTIKLQSNLDLWLDKSKSYQIKTYNSAGELVATDTWDNGTKWSETIPNLHPLDMVLMEIEPI